MKILKRLFHFLGGVHFAIALILTAALCVIAGTLLESKTGSHLLAAKWTYAHPFFQLLLSFFFINILFSAMRRWPFGKKHIPFLITHLGLLMVIAGTMIKNRFGLQGQMLIWEGSGSQQVLLPHTFALLIEGKAPSSLQTQPSLIPMPSFRSATYFPFHFPDLKCKIIGYAPHVKEEPKAWIKENKVSIAGVPHLPLEQWEASAPLPEGSTSLIPLGNFLNPWKVIALQTADVREAFEQAYLQGLTLRLKMKEKPGESLDIPLQKALHAPFTFAEGIFAAQLTLPDSSSEGNILPALQLHWKDREGKDQESFSIPLQGADALLLKTGTQDLRNIRFSADLIRQNPALCIAEDPAGNTSLFAFDRHGRMHEETFNPSDLKAIVSYDQGFGGYSVQAAIPFPSFPAGREDKERAAAFEFAGQLRQALAARPPLSPPLQFLENACQLAQVDFSETVAQFLREWCETPGMLFATSRHLPGPLDQALAHLDWHNAAKKDQQAVLWTCRLLEQIEPEIKNGQSLQSILERNRWPLLPVFQEERSFPDDRFPLNMLAEQIFSLVPYLPPLEFPSGPSNHEQASLLAAFFRIYGIDHRLLLPDRKGGEETFDSLKAYWKAQSDTQDLRVEGEFALQTPLVHQIIPDDPPPKMEDRRPGIVLEVQQGQEKQTIALAYDPQGTGMKWPVLNGEFLVRFQPVIKEIPYRLRLRQARQIYYPQSAQVYSYESDILISEKGKPPGEQTLSMNHVHETWDGYRFYLSGVGSSADSGLKRIQLAVNRDPVKYILTYPGGFLIFCGIVLLFWILPYRKKGEEGK